MKRFGIGNSIFIEFQYWNYCKIGLSGSLVNNIHWSKSQVNLFEGIYTLQRLWLYWAFAQSDQNMSTRLSTLLHSEMPKMNGVLAILSEIGLQKKEHDSCYIWYRCTDWFNSSGCTCCLQVFLQHNFSKNFLNCISQMETVNVLLYTNRGCWSTFYTVIYKCFTLYIYCLFLYQNSC